MWLKCLYVVKNQLRQDNDAVAVSNGGGVLTGLVAFSTAPRELGFSLIDAGLALGRVAVSTYDSAQAGTLRQDASDYFAPTATQFGKAIFNSDTYRLSASYGDAKVMLGTDRVGVQYKTPGSLDEVGRLTYGWGASGPKKMETVLEHNFVKIPLMPTANVYGVPVGLDVVPGIRQNITGSRTITPSINFDLSVKNTPIKFSVEFRKSGS